VIIGNSSTLATNETWRDFIESVAQDKGYINVSMVFVFQLEELFILNRNKKWRK